MTRRPDRRVSRLADLLLADLLLVGLMGWHLAGTPQQLAVIVVFDLDRFACSCRFFFLVLRERSLVAIIGWIRGIGFVGVAAVLARGWTVRVTAEAGVATFHQIPPGP
jgi:hypothetical protein